MSVLVRKIDVNIDPILFAECAREMKYQVGHGTSYDYYGNVSEANCDTIVTLSTTKMNIGVKDGVLIYDHMIESHVGRIMAKYHEKNIERTIKRSGFRITKRVEDSHRLTLTLKAS